MADVELVIEGRRKDLGGFEISRVLPYARRRLVGPFIFFDHMGPADFAPGHGVTVRPHPHIGLSTVTYLFEGSMHHRDSLGFDQVIVPGEVNWMTAGRGITHSERTDPEIEASGSRMHGIQAWVALPTAAEEQAPTFANHKGPDLPTYEEGGMFARLIAGEAFGAKAAVKTHSPLFYVHWQLQPGAQGQLPAQYPERAAYIAAGEVEIDGQRVVAGQMLVFAPGQPVLFTAITQATVMLLGGEPIGERFIEWNFVASSKDRIEAAKADWRAGRFDLPPTDNKEWIPLPPDDPPPPPEPASSRTMGEKSAGILVFRRRGKVLELLLAHPGGPFWRSKDDGAWSIPKGIVNDGEESLAAAKREFEEEVGQAIDGAFVELTPRRQKSGKVVFCWMVEADLDLASFRSISFELEWPRHSGKVSSYPEIDRVGYFNPDEALIKILPGQAPFIAEAIFRIPPP